VDLLWERATAAGQLAGVGGALVIAMRFHDVLLFFVFAGHWWSGSLLEDIAPFCWMLIPEVASVSREPNCSPLTVEAKSLGSWISFLFGRGACSRGREKHILFGFFNFVFVHVFSFCLAEIEFTGIAGKESNPSGSGAKSPPGAFTTIRGLPT
jgi:hypothetical protein